MGPKRVLIPEFVVSKPCIHWHEASGVCLFLAPADPASNGVDLSEKRGETKEI